ncbi:VQ motif-containing protein 9 [Momordica charantia]|uniref:VQ motif-containing protein 9 n=1 Tax=Momordica charantia TaxID=3673 RepID=A0A6J1BQN1_MOMCH|nr:VQ motif-containing protein 9 [Momordica charantia]
MEKNYQSSLTGDSSAGNNGGGTGRDQYLKHLNKLSHKISKPSFVKKPGFDSSVHSNPNFNQNQSLPPPPPPPESVVQAQTQPPQHHQPPVYNINKNDFRDVVQKLTGSPAHERFTNPPPIHPPKPQSSRLQRIRPPPLASVSNRPPPLLNSAVPIPQPQQPPPGLNPRNSISSATNFGRPAAPLSPLPPLPTVHAPAESPVSAYMRYLHNSLSTVESNQKQFSGFSPLAPLVSPRWNNLPSQQQLPPPPQGTIPPPPPPPSSAAMASESQPPMPMPPSPLPFGCMNSPRSAYPLLSPSMLFSPSAGSFGYPQFPLSPTVPVPSPRWRAL